MCLGKESGDIDEALGLSWWEFQAQLWASKGYYFLSKGGFLELLNHTCV